jgi:hypothetical protein
VPSPLCGRQLATSASVSYTLHEAQAPSTWNAVWIHASGTLRRTHSGRVGAKHSAATSALSRSLECRTPSSSAGVKRMQKTHPMNTICVCVCAANGLAEEHASKHSIACEAPSQVSAPSDRIGHRTQAQRDLRGGRRAQCLHRLTAWATEHSKAVPWREQRIFFLQIHAQVFDTYATHRLCSGA